MGTVFEARHRTLGRRVAIKLLHVPVAGEVESEIAAERFLREGRVAARVQHPHVVDVYDYGVDDGVPYLVMELVEGETLARRLEREAPLPLSTTVGLLLPVLSAVAELHAAGIIHRDLKPANILLACDRTGNPCPKVADFGVSRLDDGSPGLTESGVVVGTFAYMAPEQGRASRAATEKSDQYALGVILYECATGSTPFQADAPYELLQAIVDRTARASERQERGAPAGLRRGRAARHEPQSCCAIRLRRGAGRGAPAVRRRRGGGPMGRRIPSVDAHRPAGCFPERRASRIETSSEHRLFAHATPAGEVLRACCVRGAAAGGRRGSARATLRPCAGDRAGSRGTPGIDPARSAAARVRQRRSSRRIRRRHAGAPRRRLVAREGGLRTRRVGRSFDGRRAPAAGDDGVRGHRNGDPDAHGVPAGGAAARPARRARSRAARRPRAHPGTDAGRSHRRGQAPSRGPRAISRRRRDAGLARVRDRRRSRRGAPVVPGRHADQSHSTATRGRARVACWRGSGAWASRASRSSGAWTSRRRSIASSG